MMLMDGTAHDEEIDQDIREEATAQIREFVVEYLKNYYFSYVVKQIHNY